MLKSGKYAAAGAPHYWIVDPRDRSLDAYDLSGGLYRPIAHVTESQAVAVPFGESRLVADLAAVLG